MSRICGGHEVESVVYGVVCRNGHLKRKHSGDDGGSNHSEDHVHCFAPPSASRASSAGTGRVVDEFHSQGYQSAAPPPQKRQRVSASCDVYQQFSNLTILQNCKALPFVIALAAILMELCDENDPQMLCNVLEIANQILKMKKGTILARLGKNLFTV